MPVAFIVAIGDYSAKVEAVRMRRLQELDGRNVPFDGVLRRRLPSKQAGYQLCMRGTPKEIKPVLINMKTTGDHADWLVRYL